MTLFYLPPLLLSLLPPRFYLFLLRALRELKTPWPEMRLPMSIKIAPDLVLASDYGFLSCLLGSVLTYAKVAQGPVQKYQTLEMLRLLETRHCAQEPEGSEDPRMVFQPKVPLASGSLLSSEHIWLWGFSPALSILCPAPYLPPTEVGRPWSIRTVLTDLSSGPCPFALWLSFLGLLGHQDGEKVRSAVIQS